MNKNKVNIIELFNEEKINNKYLTVSAPMVRYSKLEFRTLLRKYKTKLCFTPMIIADSFCRSENARNNEFTTNLEDSPLIAQFAAKDSIEFSTAGELIYPYVDGIDLNCGCPQNWAINDGYGCALLKKPDLIYDMIKTVQRILPNNFSYSIKIRLLNNKNLKQTIDLCRKLEKCNITFITIHGRTPWQKISEKIDYNLFNDIKKSLNIPLILNGDIKTINDANLIYLNTNCDGIMVARGLLKNPTLFTNTQQTNIDCIQNWYNITNNTIITNQCYHHHLTFMLDKLLNKNLRKIFNNLTNKYDINKFLNNYFNININNNNSNILLNNLLCKYDNNLYNKNLFDMNNYNNINNDNNKNIFDDENNWNENNIGNFYNSFIQFHEK